MVVCFTFTQNIVSQQYFIKHYTIENGLPTRIVNDACQDSTGYMWFATDCGISSYDGFRFTNYDAKNGVLPQPYRFLKFDEQGTLWAIPRRLCDTVVYFKNEQCMRINSSSGLSTIEITSFDMVSPDDNPVICLGSKAGIEIYQNKHWQHINISDDPEKNQVLCITSKDNSFYIGTKSGIFLASQAKGVWSLKRTINQPLEKCIAVKFEKPGEPDEKLWILSSGRLSYMQFGKLTEVSNGFFLPEADFLGHAYVNFDNRGNVFFGNNWMKYFVNTGNHIPCPLMVENGFSSNGSSSIFIDREQNVWFADNRGIDKISNLFQMNYFEINGLLENEVTAIEEISGNRMVFGHNNGLSILDHHKFTRIPFPGVKNNFNRVLDMVRDDQGYVWIAASKLGLGKLMADGTLKWYRVDQTSIVTTVHQDVHGRIWVGTTRQLYYFKNDKFVEFAHNDLIKCNLRKLYSTKDGKIIGTGTDGLFMISGENVIKIPPGDHVTTTSFYSYFQTSDGTEYVGSLNGLFTIDRGKLRKFDQHGVTIQNPVYFIFQDRDLNFWFGSDNGVIKWDGETNFETIGLRNGLAGNETNRSAGKVDSQGNVWIGTDMGLSCILPAFSGLKSRVPVIKLLDIEDSKGKIHSFFEDSDIGFDAGNLFFHFRAISFVNEDMLSYRYKLDGFDKYWQYLNQSNLDKVKYAGLDPGKYRFMVQARNGSGEWSHIERSATIHIKPPVYHAWWFTLVIFIISCMIIFGFIKIILQQGYNLKLEKEISDRKKAEENLRESKELYEMITEKMTDVVWLMDFNGRTTFVSLSIEQFTGFSVEEYLHQSFDDRFTSESAAFGKSLFRTEMARLVSQPDKLQGYSNTLCMEYICKNGGTKWGELLVTPYFGADKTWLGIHGVTRDITDRKLAEEAFREKAKELERFNSLMIGRELKMIELKKEINELLVKTNNPEKYIVHE